MNYEVVVNNPLHNGLLCIGKEGWNRSICHYMTEAANKTYRTSVPSYAQPQISLCYIVYEHAIIFKACMWEDDGMTQAWSFRDRVLFKYVVQQKIVFASHKPPGGSKEPGGAPIKIRSVLCISEIRAICLGHTQDTRIDYYNLFS